MNALFKIASILVAVLVATLPLTFATEMALTYDANGNLVTGDGKYRTYNSLNQLWKVYNGSSSNGTLLQEYMYHPTEERVWMKKAYLPNGSLSETVYYFSKEHVRVINTTGSFDYTYVYLNGELVAQLNPDGTKLFMSNDNKGSVVVVTNGSGAVIENSTYDPLGNTLTGGNKVRFGYENKERDTILGDTDFNFRRYSSQTGLFEQPDTQLNDIYDPQQLNRYMFESGNPIKNSDPTGHWGIYWGVTASGGAVGGASGAHGRMLTFTWDDGLEIEYGSYTKTGVGSTTPSISFGTFEFGLAPHNQHARDFEGRTIDYAGDYGEETTAGVAASVPTKDGNNLNWNKASYGGTVSAFDTNPPGVFASVSRMDSTTTVKVIKVVKIDASTAFWRAVASAYKKAQAARQSSQPAAPKPSSQPKTSSTKNK